MAQHGDLDLPPLSPTSCPASQTHGHEPSAQHENETSTPLSPPRPQPRPQRQLQQPQQPRDVFPSGAASTPHSPPYSPRLQQSISSPGSFAGLSGLAGVSSGIGLGHSTSSARVRGQSTQERLDGILQAARQRAESVVDQYSSQTSTLARHATVRMEPLLRNQSAPGALDEHEEHGEHEEQAGAAEASGRASQRSARHLHYAATASTEHSVQGYGTVSRPTSVRSRRKHPAAGAPASLAAPESPEEPWWRAWLAGFQSIELENKGSVARDHLALERTFLAWLRTSLAFASIGIAVTQLFRLNTAGDTGGTGGTGGTGSDTDVQRSRLRHIGLPLGTAFLGISVLILFLGYHRFYQSQQWILRGKFPASRGTVLVVSAVALALMVTSLVVVVVVQPSG